LTAVSVVSIVRDDEIGLHKTFLSLTEQGESDWEMIIVVGESTDGSLDLAQRLQTQDQRVRTIRQVSQGIYPAMNEGVALANGEFIWFMNAGDIFFGANALTVAVVEARNRSLDLLIGGHGVDSNSNIKLYCSNRKTTSFFDFAFNRKSGCHQAMLFRTSVLVANGGFCTKYVLASDYDQVIKIIRSNRVGRHNQHLAIVEAGGISDRNLILVHQEKHNIRVKYKPNVFVKIVSTIWKTLAIRKYYILRSVSKKI
jgi:glycosyltransferase involved in cell wall biosynthesis